MTKIPTVDLTVEEIFDTPAEFDHVAEARSIGPAIALVLERDAPLRLEVLASTEAERKALLEARCNDWRFASLLDIFFDLKDEEEGIDPSGWRHQEHADRLAGGRRISTFRVGD